MLGTLTPKPRCKPNRVQILLSGLFLMAVIETSPAAPSISATNAYCFFTNVASQLLLSQLNVNMTQIEVYPACQYTPAVHRLLQLTANVYDAMTNNTAVMGNNFPSVFRPTFLVMGASGSTTVYINGFQQVVSVNGTGDPQLSQPVDASTLPPGIYTNINVYGVPWIIGAKKGFPNFNEFSMETLVGVTRRLEITRQSPSSPPYQTNQMYIMSISNSLGVECWNSYATNYVPYSGSLTIVAQDNISMWLTNEEPNGATINPLSFYPDPFPLANTVSLTEWPAEAFDLPLMTNIMLLTNCIYVYQTHSFLPVNVNNVTNYLDAGTPPMPQFGLLITNRVQVFMLDGGNVIDYVQFAGPECSTNLNTVIADNPYTGGNPNAGLWNTNSFGEQPNGTPYGVINQIYYSMDPSHNADLLAPNDNGVWNGVQGGVTVGQQVAFFDAFFSPNNVASYMDPFTGIRYTSTNTYLSVQVPFTPSSTIYGWTSWQANDPLVHYLASDLIFNGTERSGLRTGWNQWSSAENLPTNNLGRVNDRYLPWGVIGQTYPFVDTNSNNMAYKDPLVRSSDYWDFPSGQPLSPDWLGQVHRGTPWQTIYLKATNILDLVPVVLPSSPDGLITWLYWTGDYDTNDAIAMAPVQDWHIASFLSALLNSGPPASLLSVNNPNTNAWMVLFDGMNVLTNDATLIQLYEREPQFTMLVVSSNSPQAAILAGAIQAAQLGQSGSFTNVGDIMAIPQLSQQSPYLNWNSTLQQESGISDEAYEEIPAQLLPLLRVDSVGSATAANGQAAIQFTGSDGHAYAIQVSPDLVNWTSISTNSPIGGVINFTPPPPTPGAQFYRSVMVF
jgi:hypothetical protein